jgi:hypothetical protein
VHPELTDVVLLIMMQITQMFLQFLTLINIYAKLLIKEKYQNKTKTFCYELGAGFFRLCHVAPEFHLAH